MSLHLLTFDEASHSYCYGGKPVPGVTSILKPLVDFSMVPPDVLAAKADLGRRVHTACQFLDEDDLDESSVQGDVAPYLAAYRLFLTETGSVIVENERQVFSVLHGYAGTLDRVMLIRRERWLIDIKTCIARPASVGPQTAAYHRALPIDEGLRITRRGALRLRPDGTYRLDCLDSPGDWAVFSGCLAIHRHLKDHANDN